MSNDERYFDPYAADKPLLMRCSCGRHASAAEHASAGQQGQQQAQGASAATTERRRRRERDGFEAYSRDFIEASLVKALFPQDALRRRFLRAVGKGTAMAAISSLLPVASLQAMAQEARGQAITLANKHKGARDPKQWKGFKFAVPFQFSMHNFLLRYYVAEHGRSRPRHPDPRRAAARDGGQPARRQHRARSTSRWTSSENRTPPATASTSS